MDDIKTIKSENFALQIINLYKVLVKEKSELIISKQILRSGTSIGANIAESRYAESASDFVHKLAIAQKEASETNYWLRLLYRSGYIEVTQYNELTRDCFDLMRILSAIIKTKKKKE